MKHINIVVKITNKQSYCKYISFYDKQEANKFKQKMEDKGYQVEITTY